MSDFPTPAPVFMLVELPPTPGTVVQDTARARIRAVVVEAGGRARRVDQHALLRQLLARATPAMRAIAAQVFNDPDNPKWLEE